MRWEHTFWFPVEGNFQPIYNFSLEITTSTPPSVVKGRLYYDDSATPYPTLGVDSGTGVLLVPLMTTSGTIAANGLTLSTGTLTANHLFISSQSEFRDTLSLLTPNAAGAALVLQEGTSGAPGTSKSIRCLSNQMDIMSDAYASILFSVTDSGKALLPFISTDSAAGTRKFLVVSTATGSIYLSTGVEP